MRGLIILIRDIPDDFSAVSSLNSPMFPKVMSAASRIASGSAVGTKERVNCMRSSAIILKFSPLPARSSTYIHRNCKRSIVSTMKNVSMRGPINDLSTNLSTFFTGNKFQDAKLPNLVGFTTK